MCGRNTLSNLTTIINLIKTFKELFQNAAISHLKNVST